MFDRWLIEKGANMLQSFFETVTWKVNLEPELPFEDVPEGSARDKAQALWSKVQPAHVKKIKETEEEAFNTAIINLPEYVRTNMNGSTRKEFRKLEYFKMVEQIITP